MSGYRFLYRLAAGFWLVLGALMAITAFVYVVAYEVINNFLIEDYHVLTDILGKWLYSISPGILTTLGIILGLFCLYFGGSLLQLKPWTRTVGMGFHFGMGMFIVALTVSVYQLMAQNKVVTDTIGDVAPLILLGIGFILGLGIVLLGFQMGSRAAIDIFNGEVTPQGTAAKAICPTCKGPLDVNRETCSRCDGSNEQSLPNRPRLIDLQSGREYAISTVKALTYVGRENPDATLQFDDATVSKDHAVIEYADGSFFLHARQDTNGTFVNDTKIRDREIVHNDIIRFGRVKVKFITG